MDTITEIATRVLHELLPEAGDERVERAADLIASGCAQLPLTTSVTPGETDLVDRAAAELRAEASAPVEAGK